MGEILPEWLSATVFFLSLSGSIGLYLALAEYRRDGGTSKRFICLALAAFISNAVGATLSLVEQWKFEKFVTGGDSYVYPEFKLAADGSPKFLLRHAGDSHTVRGLRITIVDMLQGTGFADSAQLMLKNSQSLERLFFASDMEVSWGSTFPIPQCIAAYYAMVFTGGRSVIEIVHARKIRGEWHSATRVFSKLATTSETRELVAEFPIDGPLSNLEWPGFQTDGKGTHFFNVKHLLNVRCDATGVVE